MTNNTQQQKQSKPRVLVVGDACLDIYSFGCAKRINPEAPNVILDVDKTQEKLGMAHNVYNGFKRLGLCDVDLISNPPNLIKKHRFIDSRHNVQVLRVDHQEKIEKFELKQVKDFDIYDCLVISDYDKGFLEAKEIISLISFFVRRKKKIFIDTKKKASFHTIKDVFMKINQSEAEKFPKDIFMKHNVIVTKGEKGAWLCGKLFPAHNIPEVKDVCGAGDSFMVGLVSKYLTNGQDIEEAIKFANVYASISLRHFGTYMPTLEEVENERK